MNYFKTQNGDVYAYDAEQVAAGCGSNMTAMTPEEVGAHINPPKTPEQLQAEINHAARTYLLSTDWYIIRLQETGDPVPPEVLTERQAARQRVVD
jgi:hypothetical protein